MVEKSNKPTTANLSLYDYNIEMVPVCLAVFVIESHRPI